MTLQVNKQLKTVAAKVKPPQKLLLRYFKFSSFDLFWGHTFTSNLRVKLAKSPCKQVKNGGGTAAGNGIYMVAY